MSRMRAKCEFVAAAPMSASMRPFKNGCFWEAGQDYFVMHKSKKRKPARTFTAVAGI
jgi:hypothetical protein